MALVRSVISFPQTWLSIIDNHDIGAFFEAPQRASYRTRKIANYIETWVFPRAASSMFRMTRHLPRDRFSNHLANS